MATIKGSGAVDNQRYFHYSWDNLANSDDGAWVNIAYLHQISVQLDVGTAGAGLEVTIDGSNDGGSSFSPLNDEQGTSLALSEASIVTIQERPQLLRPRVTGGDGTTDVTVNLVGRVA